MSKLTKTIEENKKWNQHFEENPEDNLLTKLEPVNKTISYLLSLLEEKDKALAYIQERAEFELDIENTNTYNLSNGLTMIRKKAYETLNTSSNNEGDTI
ncbi:hypothetical protein D3C75_759210 [compost metagenome]